MILSKSCPSQNSPSVRSAEEYLLSSAIKTPVEQDCLRWGCVVCQDPKNKYWNSKPNQAVCVSSHYWLSSFRSIFCPSPRLQAYILLTSVCPRGGFLSKLPSLVNSTLQWSPDWSPSYHSCLWPDFSLHCRSGEDPISYLESSKITIAFIQWANIFNQIESYQG